MLELQTEEVTKLDAPVTNEETTTKQASASTEQASNKPVSQTTGKQAVTATMSAQAQLRAQMAAMQPKNKKVSAAPTPTPAPTAQTPKVNLLAVNITNENTALNVMVGFLSLAQQRGCFSIGESAKIFECIQIFRQHITTSPK